LDLDRSVYGFGTGWDVRLLVHKHRCGLLESVIQPCVLRSFGLAAESMPY
jgi:hypothetical protein